MPYTVQSSEKLKKSGSEMETKALLYLMNFNEDSSEIFYFVVDLFNDLTGMNRTARKMWDLQSKAAKNNSPKAIGRELVTLYKNYVSDFEFGAYYLFMGGVSATVRKDDSKNIFGIDNLTDKALSAVIAGLKDECGDKVYISDSDIDDNKINDFLHKVRFVVDDKTPEEYVKKIIINHPQLIPEDDKSTIEAILFDYTDDVVEKDDILGYYNLYENPTYVLIKGNARICFDESVVELSEMLGGIALSNGSLEGIRKISVKADKVITVENLTTYHDCDEPNALYIYLGGYHNTSKQRFLELIYENNGDKEYYHEGDLDVYGFLILENLILKTQIPFKPLLMDVETIERFYHAGLYKTLTARDRKMIDSKKDGQLSAYKDVLEYMLAFDCKVEQESIKAVELIERQ